MVLAMFCKSRTVGRLLPMVMAVCLALSCATVQAAAKQDSLLVTRKSAAAMVEELPQDLRPNAQRVLATAEFAAAGASPTQEQTEAREALSTLARRPEATNWILTHLFETSRQPAKRLAILMVMAWVPAYPHFQANPSTLPVLSCVASTESDTRLREMARSRIAWFSGLIERSEILQPLSAARTAGDVERIHAILEKHEDSMYAASDIFLPLFLRTPPAIFTLPIKGSAIRAVALGDFGSGKEEQHRVGEAIRTLHRKQSFDFGLTLGDNFYPQGLNRPDHPRWRSDWEEIYGRLGVPFHASLGNHDVYYDPSSAAAEILHSTRSTTWRMPAAYYSYVAGPVQFFVIESTVVSQRQLDWLSEEIDRSTARWKIVYGHHPIILQRERGGVGPGDASDDVLPVIQGRVDAYIAGHHHSLQHLKPVGGVHQFISGGGGAKTYQSGNFDREKAFFVADVPGFITLDASLEEMTFAFFGEDAQELYRYSLRKDGR